MHPLSHPNLNLRTEAQRTRQARQRLTACPPGSSKAPRSVEVRTKPTSSCPKASYEVKSSLHPSVQAMQLSHWKKQTFLWRLQSRTGQGHSVRRLTSARLPPNEAASSRRANPCGYPEKGRSPIVLGVLECVHEHASHGQHVRNQLLTESQRTCQEQNSHQIELLLTRTKRDDSGRFAPESRGRSIGTG